MAAQDETLATKVYRVTILKQQEFKKCRMFSERDEIVSSVNVQICRRQNIRSAMIRSPPWLTRNYVASMILRLPKTGIRSEKRGGGRIKT